jgi:signal transduction histidine kinase
MTEDEIQRKRIVDELAKEVPDWQLIERITRMEVDSNPASVRFSVDAGHIQRLGLELVAKQETALAELIKNAYDADATLVTVSFIGHDKPHGTLTIEDNGSGMAFDAVRDAWMRLSTSHKQDQPLSPRFNRVRAGRKGIGRFAVQRLGKTLLLETEVSGQSHGLRVYFDWDGRFNAGRDLNDVFSDVEEYEKPLSRSRTCLSIGHLRETWSDAGLRKVWKMILSLQSPFAILPNIAAATGPGNDPGFEVLLNGSSSKNQKSTLEIESGFLQYAIAEISGIVHPDGSGLVRVVSNTLALDEQHEFEAPCLLTGPLSFSAKYFIYKSDLLSGLSVPTAQEMGREYGGIRVYRNGFRVSPYGERSDDWLGLDRDTSRRVLIVPANNVNFFGQVMLEREQNPLFEETSSREGLIENEAFEELRGFVRKSLEWGFLRVAAARGRKQTTGQKDFVSTARPRKPSEVIDTLLSTFATPTTDDPFLLPTVEQVDRTGDDTTDGGATDTKAPHQERPSYELAAARYAFEAAREELKLWEADVEEREAASLQYEEMLRILASLGLSISVFGHEIKGIRGSVSAHLAVLQDEIAALPSTDSKSHLENVVKGLMSATGRMFDLGGYIAGLMSSTESRELRSLSVKGAVKRFEEQFRQYMGRQKVNFEYHVSPDNLRTVEMHASELDSVLLNFLTNSIKSMKAAKVFPRRVRITATEDEGMVVLAFEDNGQGIPAEVQDRIFDAFFTTTVNLDDDGLAGPGTGLGLKIVSDIATSYGGSVAVIEPSDGYKSSIEFRIRNDERIGD